MDNIKIRERHRIQASPPPGHRQDWWEYQVVKGRKILSCHDSREQAEKALAHEIEAALLRGDEWLRKHRSHIRKMLDEYGGGVPPIEPNEEDFLKPDLWKAIHWSWYSFQRKARI